MLVQGNFRLALDMRANTKDSLPFSRTRFGSIPYRLAENREWFCRKLGSGTAHISLFWKIIIYNP